MALERYHVGNFLVPVSQEQVGLQLTLSKGGEGVSQVVGD